MIEKSVLQDQEEIILILESLVNLDDLGVIKGREQGVFLDDIRWGFNVLFANTLDRPY